MTARGILETAGLFVDLIGKLIEMRKKEDKDRFRMTVKKHFFASREFEDRLTAKSPHVADGVRDTGPVHIRSAMAALSTARAVKTYCDIATMAFAGELQPARMIGW